MLITKTGPIKDNFHMLGSTSFPMFLLDGELPVLFEGGVTCGGRIYAEAVRSILGQRQPGMIFLTHAHWDHCAAVFYLKQEFSSLKIAASPYVKSILQRTNAIALISMLNEKTGEAIKSIPDIPVDFDVTMLLDDPFQPFEPDIELEDRQIIELGRGATVQVLATPGHTRDHTSYYLPKDKILIGGETAGLLEPSGNISTEFAYDYEAYVNSIKKLSAVPADIYCQGHGLVIVGREEVTGFLERSLNGAIAHKEEICRLLDEEQGSTERVIQRMKAIHYDAVQGPRQPEFTYMLNLTAQVKHLAAKRAQS
ncbi:MAG: MBL fold metallo-hydrolase [Chitinophagales bacterium]